MRQIGTLEKGELAERFVDYLTTLEISAISEQDADVCRVWVHDENQVEAAKSELAKFSSNPDLDVYRDARRSAAELKNRQLQRRRAAQKNIVEVRSSWSGPISKRAPLTLALMVACVAVVVLGGGFGSLTAVDRALMFCDPLLVAFRGRGLVPFASIFGGQVWRLVTPILLHGDLIHLLMNMYWMHHLGGQIEPRVGPWKYALLVLAAAIFPNMLQAILVGANFVGISGVVFGLFGYMWMRRSDGYMLNDQTILIVLLCFAVGFIPSFGLAAWAHAGGLMVGTTIGYLSAPKWRA